MLATIQGTIARRVLVNYRVRPDAVAKMLPPVFRPQLVEGWSIAGICLIGLKDIRPSWLPGALGCSSENAAHRVAVEWDEAGATRTGVYIPRRDSSSMVNHLAGGRLFPGEHHAARFAVDDQADRVRVTLVSKDSGTRVHVSARISSAPPRSSVFRDTSAASAFFRGGCIGYSARCDSDVLDGVELCCDAWNISALDVDAVSSSYFEDKHRFAPSDVEFDSAFIMRNIPHRWIAKDGVRLGARMTVTTAE